MPPFFIAPSPSEASSQARQPLAETTLEFRSRAGPSAGSSHAGSSESACHKVGFRSPRPFKYNGWAGFAPPCMRPGEPGAIDALGRPDRARSGPVIPENAGSPVSKVGTVDGPEVTPHDRWSPEQKRPANGTPAAPERFALGCVLVLMSARRPAEPAGGCPAGRAVASRRAAGRAATRGRVEAIRVPAGDVDPGSPDGAAGPRCRPLEEDSGAGPGGHRSGLPGPRPALVLRGDRRLGRAEFLSSPDR